MEFASCVSSSLSGLVSPLRRAFWTRRNAVAFVAAAEKKKSQAFDVDAFLSLSEEARRPFLTRFVRTEIFARLLQRSAREATT